MTRRHAVVLGWVCVLMLGGQHAADAQVTGPFNVRALPSPQCPTSATGGGSIDDWEAFRCAIGLVPESGGEIYIPAGTYKLTKSLYVRNKNITFRGEGQRITNLVWHGAIPAHTDGTGGNGGIEFLSDFGPVNHTLNVRSLSLLRKQGIQKSGIYASWRQPSSASSYGGTSATIFDVHISSDPFPSPTAGPDVAYWTSGIRLARAVGARIHTFNIHGYLPNISLAGIEIHESIGVSISDGDTGKDTYGVLVSTGSESVRVENVETSQNHVGFFFQTGKHHILTNSHVGVSGYGVAVNDASDTVISGNFFILVTTGIQIWNPAVAGSRFQVRNNLVIGEEAANEYGITITGSATDVTVIGNQVRYKELTTPQTRRTILLGAGVSRALVTGNYLRAFAVQNDAGIANHVVDNY